MTTSVSPRHQSLKTLTVFVACPGDCATERGFVDAVARELEPLANHHGHTLKIRNWTQVLPDMGRPQQVIFDQMPVETWDILICILWLRFGMKSGGTNPITGQPTESGTEEEFVSALNAWKSTGRPRILFYRRTAGPPDMSRFDIPQFNLIQEFFKKFDVGHPYEGLYKPYDALEEFRRILREHLQYLLIQTELPTALMTLKASPDADSITSDVVAAWRERLLTTYDVLKLHRISSAYDAGTVLRADRDRVRLHDVFVPQNVCDVSAIVAERLPVPQDLTKADADELGILGIQHRQELSKAKRHRVYEMLDSEKNNQTVLLGSPGAGKSSLLQYRALTWARNTSFAGPIPLLLEMRQYAARVARARQENQTQPSLLTWAGELLGSVAGVEPIPEETISLRLSTGGMVLYCDALDEIFDPELRRATAEQLLQIAIEMPTSGIVVTSRPVGYPDDVLGPVGFGHWLVQDFDKKQIQEFLARWIAAALPDQDDRANVTARMNSALELRRVREMAGNPLLLTLMSILARTDELPRDRMRLYEKAAELLLYQWDTTRSLRPIEGLDFAYDQKHRVLRELAWRMQNAQLGLGGNLASLEMVREVFDEELKADLDRPGERARGVSVLLETLRVRDHVLCHLGGDRFAFVHRGFLEYFCADWLRERVRRAPSTAEEDLFNIFQSYALVAVWAEVLGLGVLALAPEVADPIFARIEPVLTKRGTFPRWLAEGTLTDIKKRARYPKTVVFLQQKLIDEIKTPSGRFSLSQVVYELARYWPDEETRALLQDIVDNPKSDQKARRAGINLLIKIWPSDDTRSLVTKIAKNERGRACRVIMTNLIDKWPDEETRMIVTQVASGNPDSRTTATAISLLVRMWPDELSKKLLQKIADQFVSTRAGLAASRNLAFHWRVSPPPSSAP